MNKKETLTQQGRLQLAPKQYHTQVQRKSCPYILQLHNRQLKVTRIRITTKLPLPIHNQVKSKKYCKIYITSLVQLLPQWSWLGTGISNERVLKCMFNSASNLRLLFSVNRSTVTSAQIRIYKKQWLLNIKKKLTILQPRADI